MNARSIMEGLIARENEYLAKQTVGTEEYNASLERLSGLEEKLVAFDRVNDDKKDRAIRYVMEAIKIATGIVLPIVGLVVITAEEREITYRSALKGFINYFLPGKMKV